MGVGRRRNEEVELFEFNVMIICTKKIVIVVPLTETLCREYLYKKNIRNIKFVVRKRRVRVFS